MLLLAALPATAAPIAAPIVEDREFIQALEAVQRSRPDQLSSKARIAPESEPGTPLVLHGRAFAADGRTQLRLRLTERDGAALAGAQAHVEAFPNAYAARVERLTLTEIEPGVYAAWLTRSTPGLWELRLDLTRDARQFRQVMRVDVTRPVKS